MSLGYLLAKLEPELNFNTFETMLFKNLKQICVASLCAFTFFSNQVLATVVEVRTNVGNFQINLFDEDTPRTVENFLSYVNAGAYTNNVVHRSVPGFVVQMGGFQFNDSFPPDPIATATPVQNEPVLSNVVATVAMAKLNNQPDSATSQFFVNIANNSSNLDTSNSGFSVFGQVIGDGMTVVNQIAGLDRFGFASPFNEIPLQNYSATDAQNGVEITRDNVVLITDIVVIDSAVVTNPDLDPVENTRINAVPTTPPSNDGTSGGALSYGLLILFVALFRRQWFK
jgi:peptidyl-prolyl cis-trans isomerase A (cyclophilin A)